MANDIFALGRATLAAQPFSVRMGADLIAFSSGRVELTMPLMPEHSQHLGVAHGVVVSFMADTALTFAGGSVLGPDVLTAEYNINYVRPAVGERLVARGHVVAGTTRQAVSRCDVFVIRDGQERLCATAQGTIVKRAERDTLQQYQA